MLRLLVLLCSSLLTFAPRSGARRSLAGAACIHTRLTAGGTARVVAALRVPTQGLQRLLQDTFLEDGFQVLVVLRPSRRGLLLLRATGCVVRLDKAAEGSRAQEPASTVLLASCVGYLPLLVRGSEREPRAVLRFRLEQGWGCGVRPLLHTIPIHVEVLVQCPEARMTELVARIAFILNYSIQIVRLAVVFRTSALFILSGLLVSHLSRRSDILRAAPLHLNIWLMKVMP